MNETGNRAEGVSVADLGLEVANAYWNLSPKELQKETIERNQGKISSTGTLVVNTGEFTGRSPKDRFIVEDDNTKNTVWWGDINLKISPENFDKLHKKILNYLKDKDVFVRDAYACADPAYRLNLRVVTEYPWSNMFAYNMFLRPSEDEISNFQPEWTILCAPGLKANPEEDGTRQHNFAIINFTKKMIIIGGTGYTGEIKKGIFSVLNYLLPHEKDTLSMHCSANIGSNNDTAVFFGLSGTGKTTLSADPNRKLIGDDEHGWAKDSVFNFEGGCYAKCIDLTQEKEPQIWDAIKEGAILENIGFVGDSNVADYSDSSITENTRVSYPIYHIDNIAKPSIGTVPRNIFFLTCDAYGVLPPISKLTPGQAMYHFISGYTAKVAGTEAGITEPVTAFSACFGAPFLPLHPTKYAEMLGAKMRENDVNIWLVNTGWSGGAYGTGSRIKLKFTRAMITSALNGDLNNVEYHNHPVFGLAMPKNCPNVPDEILNPKSTWENQTSYDNQASKLAEAFNNNFEQFADNANEEILSAAPKMGVTAS
ncbi:MAG: phosphoenolpyruvate carboxykinase (ATP) [Flavobacteriales bacterium]|nr:phosphoenolpyruvate carboxykinase (ATP) [Flavobacteriales bacterium]